MILSKPWFISIYSDIRLQTCAHCHHEFQKTEYWNKMTCPSCHEDTCYLCHGVRQTSPLISTHCSQAVADISAHFYGPHIFGTVAHIFGTMPHILCTMPQIFGEKFFFGEISVLRTYPFWWQFRYSNILGLITFQFWWYFIFGDISNLVTF